MKILSCDFFNLFTPDFKYKNQSQWIDFFIHIFPWQSENWKNNNFIMRIYDILKVSLNLSVFQFLNAILILF